VILQGNGHGPDQPTTMESVNGIIKRGIIDESLQLIEQAPE
jgi:hypothetical protein